MNLHLVYSLNVEAAFGVLSHVQVLHFAIFRYQIVDVLVVELVDGHED